MSSRSRDSIPHARPTTPRQLAARAFRRQRSRITAGTVLLSGHQLSEALVPVMIGVTIDSAVTTGQTHRLVWCLLGLVAVFATLVLCWRYGARCIQLATLNEAHWLRTEIADQLLSGEHVATTRTTGELLSIASSDADRAATTIEWRAGLVAASSGIVVAAVVLVQINIWLGLLVMLGVPAVLGALRGFGPAITRRSIASQEAAGHTTALASDLMRGLRAIRGIGAVESAASRYRQSSQTALHAEIRAAVAKSAQSGAGAAFNGIFLAIVAAVAALLTNSGHITIGQLITVVGLAQFIAEPVGSMAGRIKELAVAQGSAHRVVELLNTSTNRDSQGLSPGDQWVAAPHLRLESVSCGSLHDLSLDITPGELIGVVSDDPRDAVALTSIFSRSADHHGSVYADAVEIRDLSTDFFRAVFLAEPLAIDLFEGTIEQNLFALAEPDNVSTHARDIEHAALIASAADELIASQHSGLSQLLVERGASLSGGQRQRLALARALSSDAPVVLLCNPTTAVDAVTEELIAQGIAQLRHAGPGHARTTVIVSNSPALLGAAHRVILLQDGRIAAEGTHRELTVSNPSYRNLVLR